MESIFVVPSASGFTVTASTALHTPAVRMLLDSARCEAVKFGRAVTADTHNPGGGRAVHKGRSS